MKYFFIALFLIGALFFDITSVKAASEDACSIWLCLPGGFPAGCAGAYSEFKHRLKKGKSPLPNLSSCTSSPDGTSSNGYYQMGVEYFFPCRDGFQYSRKPESYSDNIMCVPTNLKCSSQEKFRRENKIDCTPYKAQRRQQTRFVKMWVDGEYLGQFFYK